MYHVTIRGNQRGDIFRADQDRKRFLLKLCESLQRFNVRLYLYCLMTNHVHMVLETPRKNLSRFMHRLQTAYTVYFNRRYQLSGHLMQGRFRAALVEQDEHMLKLSRYVHLNPVYIAEYRDEPYQARLDILRQYVWSSYHSYTGMIRPSSYVDHTPILAMMDTVKRRQRSVYRRFVEGGIRDVDTAFVESKERSRLCIGSDTFHERVEALYQSLVDGRDSMEDASFHHIVQPVSMDQVLACVCQELEIDRSTLTTRQRDCLSRPVAARALCNHAGMTQREVAKFFNLSSGGAVSKQLARLGDRAKRDKRVALLLARIDRAVEECH